MLVPISSYAINSYLAHDNVDGQATLDNLRCYQCDDGQVHEQTTPLDHVLIMCLYNESNGHNGRIGASLSPPDTSITPLKGLDNPI